MPFIILFLELILIALYTHFQTARSFYEPAPTPEMRTQRIQLFQGLTIYLGPPRYLLLCRVCRTAVPLSTFPYRFSRTTRHTHSYSDCKQPLQVWKDCCLPTHPVQLTTHADTKAWARPIAG